MGAVALAIAYLSLDLIVRQEGTVYITQDHENVEDVAAMLVDSGFVRREATITFIASLKKMKDFKRGRYEIQKDEDWPTVINRFRIGDQQAINVVVTSSRDWRSLSAKLGRQLMGDSADFYKYLSSEAALSQSGMDRAGLPSIIIPNTYQMYWTSSPEEFLERMLRENEAFWQNRDEKLKRLNMSRVEAVILASIVESETNKVDEMPTVAGLYLNRLRAGWKLQSDPTALYGMRQAFPDSVVRRVLYSHLEFDSPYNTYIYKGLPPGPISFPSSQAIEAVLNAENHSYYYMVASVEKPGYHAFSKRSEYSRHTRLAREYQAYLTSRNL